MIERKNDALLQIQFELIQEVKLFCPDKTK